MLRSNNRRCPSRYSAQVRCEDVAGHTGTHRHSFYARYWTDTDRPTVTARPDRAPVTQRDIAEFLTSFGVR